MNQIVSKKLTTDKSIQKRDSRSPQDGRRPVSLSRDAGLLTLQSAIGNRAFGQVLQAVFGNPIFDQKDAPSIIHSEQRHDSGRPLEPGIRDLMESRFGEDLHEVRVYADAQAKELTGELKAAAFTTGNHIFFSPEKYNSQSHDGRRLIAHELTHVLQHRKTDALESSPSISRENSTFEEQARHSAETVMAGKAVTVNSSNGAVPFIQRQPLDSKTSSQEKTAENLPDATSDPFIQEVIGLLQPYAVELGEIVIENIPVVGDVYDAVTGTVGNHLITGEKLDPIDRISYLSGLVPIPFVTGKVLRKAKEIIEGALQKAGINPVKFLQEAIPKAIDAIKVVWDKVVDEVQRRLGKKVEIQAPQKGIDTIKSVAPSSPVNETVKTSEVVTVQAAKAAGKVLQKRIAEIPILKELWIEAGKRSRKTPDLTTSENARGAFDNHRDRFWKLVSQNKEAKNLFEQAGFVFGSEPAPIFSGLQGRFGKMSIEHIERIADRPSNALDPENLQFLVMGDNTLLDTLKRKIPDWPAGSLVPLKGID